MSKEWITIFSGSWPAEGRNRDLNYTFTSHVGGDFDTSLMNEESCFEVNYAGPEQGVDLVLISHSGGNRWGRMKADRESLQPDGTRTAVFTYENMVRTYGGNFTRLDETRCVTNSDEKTVLKSIRYFPGEGTPVDTSSPRWDKPDTGIAFIGDSIVQNVFYNEGDFNTLLGRSDCVNFGIGAQTTVHCLNRIGEIAGRHYSRLVIWCGINDLWSGTPAEDVTGRIQQMIARTREKNPGMRFVIISILPTAAAWYPKSQHVIRAINALNEEYAVANDDVDFVNCYPRLLGEDGFAKADLFIDGLHPNSEGYALVKECLLPVLAGNE